MKEILKSSLKQATPILISAGIAAGITFLQALSAGTTACALPEGAVADAGFLGAAIKAVHTAIRAGNVIV